MGAYIFAVAKKIILQEPLLLTADSGPYFLRWEIRKWEIRKWETRKRKQRNGEMKVGAQHVQVSCSHQNFNAHEV